MWQSMTGSTWRLVFFYLTGTSQDHFDYGSIPDMGLLKGTRNDIYTYEV